MSWTFSYKLTYAEQSVSLRRTLREAGIIVGNTVKIGISGSYKGLYENEIRRMWEPDKVYDMMSMSLREIDLKKKIEERGRLAPGRLKQIADRKSVV